ncbi:GlcG/HbpS family heme-binding protein [Methyloversatilis discipulorum]|uniref:GlcG/HbpS family heme-binding protein n=1 Tax=Methyloversatilis discipulorum TaxID=1119528 RepID=UPI001A4F32A7|nr:heme-binding protein [Methyloversatilis discipulorum]MBL8466845.1 heme-binding protein [Methyloversatilis discipulorum]
MKALHTSIVTSFAVLAGLVATPAFAAPQGADIKALAAECAALPGHAELREALTRARRADNGGFDLDMWGTVVSRSGTVCAVAFTGESNASQWPGSRAISAQKANTANAFSLPTLALATANLYSATQPGGSLFGLQESNPVNAALAYAGPATAWGQANDPLVGQRMGGVNVFGGGLALYSAQGELLGALGVSGDSSCADHAIAWRTRNLLRLDYVPAGVGPDGVDQISFDGDWKQPHCVNAATEDAVVKALPPTRRREGLAATTQD